MNAIRLNNNLGMNQGRTLNKNTETKKKEVSIDLTVEDVENDKIIIGKFYF